MAKLKFYKTPTSPPTPSDEGGDIWFDSTTRTIKVWTGSEWELYLGGGEAPIINPITRTTLFEVELTNLNFGEVTLSRDIESFDDILIYGSTDDYTLVTTTIEPKVGDQFGLVGMSIENGEFMIKTKTYSIQSSSLIPTSIAGLCSVSQGGNVVMMDQYYIGIYKVIGVKY